MQYQIQTYQNIIMPLTYIYNDINEEFFFTQQMRVGGIPDAGSWEEPVPNFINIHKPLLW